MADPAPLRADVPAGLADELRATVRATRQLFGAAACSCALATEAGDALVFVAADGAGADAIVGVEIPVGRGIAGWAAMTGQPITVADVEKDARFARDVAESTDYVPSTILAAPVMAEDGEVSGVIEVLDPSRPEGGTGIGALRGSSAELALLTLVSTQLSTVVRLSRTLGSRPQATTPLLGSVGPDAERLAEQVMAAVADFLRNRG